MSGALLLLADSQLLFRKDRGQQLHAMVRERFSGPLEAAYLGAANGHENGFYELACEGLNSLFGFGVKTHFVRTGSDLPKAPCSVVLLSGGSVATGWHMIGEKQVRGWLQRCHELPCSLMIGVSAGAIHLANGIDPDRPELGCQPFLNWFPHCIAVHEEHQGWPSLVKQRGLGIPLGGGVWVEQAAGLQIQDVGAVPTENSVQIA